MMAATLPVDVGTIAPNGVIDTEMLSSFPDGTPDPLEMETLRSEIVPSAGTIIPASGATSVE